MLIRKEVYGIRTIILVEGDKGFVVLKQTRNIIVNGGVLRRHIAGEYIEECFSRRFLEQLSVPGRLQTIPGHHSKGVAVVQRKGRTKHCENVLQVFIMQSKHTNRFSLIDLSTLSQNSALAPSRGGGTAGKKNSL